MILKGQVLRRRKENKMDGATQQYERETWCPDCEEGYCRTHGVDILNSETSGSAKEEKE